MTEIANFANNEYKNNEEFFEKSTAGSSSKRTRTKHGKVTKKSLPKRIIKILLPGAVTASTVIAGGAAIKEKLEQNMVVNELSREFDEEVLKPNIHPAQDPSKYWYDYDGIAEDLKEAYDNYDEAIYFLKDNLYEYNASSNLDTIISISSNYNNFNEFLSKEGFKDENTFDKEMKKEIIVINQIDKKEEELKNMQEERTKDELTAAVYGGK